MKLIEVAQEAEQRMNQLWDSLEANPERIVLINSVILFEDLFYNYLSGVGQRPNLNDEYICFSKLIDITRATFVIEHGYECWDELKNLAKLRNHAAHRMQCDLTLGNILPQYVHGVAHPMLPKLPCSLIGHEDFRVLLKKAIQFLYIQMYMNLKTQEALITRNKMYDEMMAVADYLFKQIEENPELKKALLAMDEESKATAQ